MSTTGTCTNLLKTPGKPTQTAREEIHWFRTHLSTLCAKSEDPGQGFALAHSSLVCLRGGLEPPGSLLWGGHHETVRASGSVSDHFCEGSDTVMMVLQLSTFSPSCMFVFIGDPMALCSGRITGSHPFELLCLTSGSHSDHSNAHAVLSTLVQGVRTLYMSVYSQRQICETVSAGGGIWLQEGIILFAYLRMSAQHTTTWAGWCLGTELNVLVSSKWPTFNRLTTSPSFTFLHDRNRSFPTYCCTRTEPRFKEQPAVLLGVVCRLLRLAPESHWTNMWSVWACPSQNASLSIMQNCYLWWSWCEVTASQLLLNKVVHIGICLGASCITTA